VGKSSIYGEKVRKVLSEVKCCEGNLKYGGNRVFPRMSVGM
jgi:hypothetical protein